MSPYGWVALGVLVVATVLFITKWQPVPVTALAIPVVLYATGAVSTATALSGFGNKAALAIAGVFVIGGALKESGVATLMARGLQRVGGTNEIGLIVALMTAAALLSAVMSNAAVVAMLLPVGVVLSRRSGVSASRLLMPLAFAAMLGGTITLIGTAPNILVEEFLSGHTEEAGGVDFEVFDFASVGVLITGAGILFMALVGRRFLPVSVGDDRLGALRLPEEVAESYDIRETLFMLTLIPASKVVGRTIAEAQIRSRYAMEILMVRRASPMGDRWLQPDPEVRFQPGDRLYVQGKEESAWGLAEGELMQFGLAGPRAVSRILGRGVTLAEVTLPPRSRALGRTIRDIHFRQRFGLNVLMLVRRDERVDEGPNDLPLEIGDTFLVSGPASRVRNLKARPDFIVMSDIDAVEDVTRAPLAIAILAVALVPPIFFGWPLALSAIGAALLMVVTGCISRPALTRAIDWNVLALIAGTLPLGAALAQHGVAEVAATAITSLGGGEVGVYVAIFTLAATLAVLTSNAAAAVIVAPVVIATGVDPRSGLLCVAYGASCAFLLPFAQCNILVMAPGGYSTRDFVRIGSMMSVVMALATIIGLLLFV